MKLTKKALSIVLALSMLISTFAFLASYSASAVTPTEGVLYPFTSYYRNYAYGEWPDKVTYSDTGYMTMESTRYSRQHQLYYFAGDDWEAQTHAAIELANSEENEGVIAIDLSIEHSKSTTPTGVTDSTCEMIVNFVINYCEDGKDWSDYTTANPAPKSVCKVQKWYPAELMGSGKWATYYLDVSEAIDFEKYKVKGCLVSAMNYSCATDPTGQIGCGDLKIRFSPFYVKDSTTPKKYLPALGNDLGEDFDPDTAVWDPNALKGDGPYITLANGYEVNGRDISRTAAANSGTPTTVTAAVEKPSTTALYGDVNGDNDINTKDVLALRKFLAKWEITINNVNADCNGDGDVNTKDVLILRKYLAKWEVKLGPTA